MLFSILVASYNQAKTIELTLSSCLNQTFDDYEVIVSDDCSQDNTAEVVKSFHSEKIKFFKQQSNLKEYPNRNFLISKATGDYLIFIDAEDIIYPQALSVLSYYVLKFPHCGLYTMRGVVHNIVYPIKLNPLEFYQYEFLSDSSITGRDFTTMLFNRQLLLKAGSLPNNIRTGDTYTQLLLAQNFDTLIISDGLTWWRFSTGNVTSKLINPEYSKRDYSHMASELNYRIDFIENPHCPLDYEDKEDAKKALYGRTLRFLVRWLLKMRFCKLYYFLKNSSIPMQYWYTIFVPFKPKHFVEYNNDNPFIQFHN